jgi:class 3 adenylate cyclase
MHHRIAYGRYLAENIPGATLVEVDGADSYPLQAGDTTEILDAVEQFLTGEKHAHDGDRMLSTILFTDIVGSTDRAAAVGDQQRLDDLAVYDRVTREHLEQFRGKFCKTTGDGVVATFDGPARAVSCALRLQQELDRLGLQIRVRVHTGEIEVRDNEIGGIGVHIASRVMDHARDSHVAASSTVRDLVVGSGFALEPMGSFALKVCPGTGTCSRSPSRCRSTIAAATRRSRQVSLSHFSINRWSSEIGDPR